MRCSLFVLGALAVTACQSEAEDDVGVISLAVAAAPSGAACLRVTVTGGSGGAVRTLGLTTGKVTTGTLPGLPLGQVTVKAEALAAVCSAVTENSVATWVSDAVPAFLTAGAVVPVQLVMQKAGQISVAVDWNTGSGGSGGSGGTGGGTGGKSGGGSGGSSGGKGGGDPLGVATDLNGSMMTAPCKTSPAGSVCQTSTTNCPNNSEDPTLDGVLLTDKTITLGGTPGKSYGITLHVQGEVEAKRYVGGVDAESTSTSPSANGFVVGGTPDAGNAYGVWMIRVTNPDGSGGDYFLNSLLPPGVSNHTTYGVDYVATINAQAGAMLRLVASDSNCSQTKNCGPIENNGSICTAPIVLSNVDPVARSLNPSFDFSKAYNGQWLSLVVSNVTEL
jgi:hypothetical protein